MVYGHRLSGPVLSCDDVKCVSPVRGRSIPEDTPTLV